MLATTLTFLLSLSQGAQDPKPEPKMDPPKQEAPKAKSPIDVWFEDGLRFKSQDGNFEAKIGGRLLAHYRTIFGRPFETQGAPLPVRDLPNTFFVRQARLETEGTLLKEWGYKVQVDFPTGGISQSTGTAASNVSGTLRDAFVEWKKYKAFQVRLGQFFEPVSQEDVSSTRFIDFAERSVINRLLPGRELGLQFSGSLMDGELAWFAMVCNGNALLNDQGRAVLDGNDQKEVAGRILYSPFLNGGDAWLKGLRIGLAGTYGSIDTVSSANFDLISTELSVMYADSNPAASTFDGFRGRINPQLSWATGPYAFRAEYLYRTDELLTSAGPDALRTKGFYVYSTYILTGEDKKVEDRIVPKGDWGAFELAFRIAQVKIDDAYRTGLFTQAGNAERITTFTLGLNWWITRNVRFSLNFVREKYSDHIAFENNRIESMLMGAIVRGQVDF